MRDGDRVTGEHVRYIGRTLPADARGSALPSAVAAAGGPRHGTERAFLTLYHGTSSHRAGNIRRVGLSSPGGTNALRYTLTEDREVAKAYAEYAALREARKGSVPVIVQVRVPRAEAPEYLFPRGEHGQTRDGRLVKWGVYAIRKKLPPRFVASSERHPAVPNVVANASASPPAPGSRVGQKPLGWRYPTGRQEDAQVNLDWDADRRALVVEHFYIDPKLRGKGLGRATVEALEAEARQRGAMEIEFWVARDEATRRFYERMGYDVHAVEGRKFPRATKPLSKVPSRLYRGMSPEEADAATSSGSIRSEQLRLRETEQAMKGKSSASAMLWRREMKERKASGEFDLTFFSEDPEKAKGYGSVLVEVDTKGIEGRFSAFAGRKGEWTSREPVPWSSVVARSVRASAPWSPRTAVPFSTILYRGEGDAPQEAAKDRIPSQFAVGQHWTPDRDVAATYGPHVREETVSLRNPYVWRVPAKGFYKNEMRVEFGTDDPAEVTRELSEAGHDGLVVQNVGTNRVVPERGLYVAKWTTEVILFHPREAAKQEFTPSVSTQPSTIPGVSDDKRFLLSGETPDGEVVTIGSWATKKEAVATGRAYATEPYRRVWVEDSVKDPGGDPVWDRVAPNVRPTTVDDLVAMGLTREEGEAHLPAVGGDAALRTVEKRTGPPVVQRYRWSRGGALAWMRYDPARAKQEAADDLARRRAALLQNPDRNEELFHQQNEYVERIPKAMENRELGYVMEAAGDIFRELTGRTQADTTYIGEKVDRIERTLNHPADVVVMRNRLEPEDQGRADRYGEWWARLPADLPPRTAAARDLNVALARQNALKAREALARLEAASKDVSGPSPSAASSSSHDVVPNPSPVRTRSEGQRRRRSAERELRMARTYDMYWSGQAALELAEKGAVSPSTAAERASAARRYRVAYEAVYHKTMPEP